MKYIELKDGQESSIVIMIFCEGTILKPKTLFSLFNHKSYVPVGSCVKMILHWQAQGAKIIYCTSRKGKQAELIADLLLQYGFPGSCLYFREKGEHYRDIVEKLKPSILIEDDCRSIGGAWQMCITKVTEDVKKQIKSIV